MKSFFKFILIIISLVILYSNYRLYYHPTFSTDKFGVYNKSVYHQLQFLKERIHKGEGVKMQRLFPEGFMFFNTLYGLTWVELIQSLGHDSPIYKEGIEEVDWTLRQIESDRARSVFVEAMPLRYGVFYRGWQNYLLAKYLSIQEPEQRKIALIDEYRYNCNEITSVFQLSKGPYLDSYPGQCWPADNSVAIASISLAKDLLDTSYSESIQHWLEEVQNRLDPDTGLIPHSVQSQDGGGPKGSRGSSQSLMINFLGEIDSSFASSQFGIYRDLFVDYRFGLPGILEYPKGKTGMGDIDSGPVILGVGGAASIVGQRVMREYGQPHIYEGLRNSLELFGLAHCMGGKKRYLLSQLTMVDAFVAWSNVGERQDSRIESTGNWRWCFQLGASTILLVLFSLFFLKYKRW